MVGKISKKDLRKQCPINNRMMFSRERFGYHVVYDKTITDAIDFATANDFGYIVPDLMIPRFWPEKFSSSERKKIRDYAEKNDVSISFHAPSDNLNLGAPYPEVRDGIHKRMKKCLELAKDLGAERFTIHPSHPMGFVSGGKPGTYFEDHRGFYYCALLEGISGILREANDVSICVENEPLTPFIQEVLENLFSDWENLFLTLDAPKSLDHRKGSPSDHVEAFYQKHIKRVREVHLHDKRPGGRFHDTLGHGDVDVEKYLKWFAEYDVHFTLEIRPRKEASRSLVLIKKILETI